MCIGWLHSWISLTVAGVIQKLSSRAPLLRGGRREKQTSGLNLRVADLPLDVPLGDLCHRVNEDQLPLPPLPPGPLLRRRFVLDTGRVDCEQTRPWAGGTCCCSISIKPRMSRLGAGMVITAALASSYMCSLTCEAALEVLAAAALTSEGLL